MVRNRNEGAFASLRDGAAGEVGAQLVTMGMGSVAVSCPYIP